MRSEITTKKLTFLSDLLTRYPELTNAGLIVQLKQRFNSGVHNSIIKEARGQKPTPVTAKKRRKKTFKADRCTS